MFKKAVKAYYKFFDETVKNWTLVVFLVTIIILTIGFLSQQEKTISHVKTSLIESYEF